MKYIFVTGGVVSGSVVVNIISLSRFQEALPPLFTKAFSQPKPSERLQNFHIYAMLFIDVSWAFPDALSLWFPPQGFFMSITACPMPAVLL